MPTEDHDSWLGALGIDVDQIRNKVQGVVGDVETKVEQGIDSVVQGATQLYKDAENAVTQTVQKVENAGGQIVDAVKRGVDAAKMKALGDQSGKAVPRPIEADCKPEHGYVPGPKNHLLCATHGHVIDTDQGTIIAESVASYVKQGVPSVMAKAESADNAAGKAVVSAKAAVGDAGQAISSVASTVETKLENTPSLGALADDAAQGALNAGANAAQGMIDNSSLGDGTKKVLTSDVNFWKGVGEGVYGAGKGIVSGAKSAVDMMDGQVLVNAGTKVAAAVGDDNARDSLIKEVEGDVNQVGDVANTAVNPLGTLLKMGKSAYDGYTQAAAQGKGDEYVGQLGGTVAVNVLLGAAGGGEAGPGEGPPPEGPPPEGPPPEGPPPEGRPSGGDAPPSSKAGPPSDPPPSSSEPPPSSDPVGPPNAYGPVDMKGDPWAPDNDPLLRTEPGPPEKDPMAKWKDPEQFKKWAEQRAAQRANELMKENPGSFEQGRHGETDARAGAQLQREGNQISDPILRDAYVAKAKELLNRSINHR
jgi:hypothetical protein